MRIRANKPQRAAVIYCRVSTDAQTDNTSLAGQFAAAAKKAEELRLPLALHIEDTESGSLYLARPKIQEALAAIEAGQADTLIIYRLDRAGRDVDALRDIRRRVERAGGQLVFADGMQFEKSAVGNLMFTQMGAYAEFERAQIRDRTVSGRRNRVKQGVQVARSAPPYGYRIVTKADIIRGDFAADYEGRYIIVEEQADVVREIFKSYLELKSVRAVVARLNESSIKPLRARLWSTSTIHAMLTNPVYHGQAVYGRRERHTDERRADSMRGIVYYTWRDESEWLILEAPPIIDSATWEAVQRLKRDGAVKRTGPTGTRYLLTGLVHCPRCGRKMYAQKHLVSRATHTREREHMFRCSQVWPGVPGDAEERCQKKRFLGLALEWLVIHALLKLADDSAPLAEAAKRYEARRRSENRTSGTAHEIARLKREITACEKKEATAAEAFINTGAVAYEKLRAETETRRRALEKQLIDLENALVPPADTFTFPPNALELLRAAVEGEVTETTRELIHAVVQRIYPLPWDNPKFRKINVGGVAIVMCTREKGPHLIVRHVIKKRGANAMPLVTDITVEISESEPVGTPSERA
jgi:DNA invertase Pin-like site-specific DNA recombinase